MGERKVLNKYFPPDFDPAFAPRRKVGKNPLVEVRMMLPMSIQCATCGEFMYRGKKFNSKKEVVEDESYHGIRIFRFYIKCSMCNAEITFKTDPKTTDYVAEKGCSRNFEPWRESETQREAAARERKEEEEGDKMKTTENRAAESRREMEQLDALDEIKAQNQRHERVDTAKLLRFNAQQQAQQILGSMADSSGAHVNPPSNQALLDDEAELRSIKFGNAGRTISRLSDSDSSDSGSESVVASTSTSDATSNTASRLPAAPTAVAATLKMASVGTSASVSASHASCMWGGAELNDPRGAERTTDFSGRLLPVRFTATKKKRKRSTVTQETRASSVTALPPSKRQSSSAAPSPASAVTPCSTSVTGGCALNGVAAYGSSSSDED